MSDKLPIYNYRQIKHLKALICRLQNTSSPATNDDPLTPESSSFISYNVENYDSLLLTATSPQEYEFAYVREEQGTSWLPSSLGGTYYGVGLYMYDGTNWVDDDTEIHTVLDGLVLNTLDNRIIVKQSNIATTLGGTIDPFKEYFIDGIIDMGTTQIEVPTGGINLKGYDFDISKLTSSENNYTMFTSPVGGSGNMLGIDYAIEVTGVNSKVYELKSATGFEAFEFQRINYNGCTSLGSINNYRQGLESGTGRFGGSPSLELIGTWVGGYRITTSIVRSLSAGMTEPLFKAGAGFTMKSRFLSDINLDLPTSAAFLDFAPANFINPSTLQLNGCTVTRNGVTNSADTNITPNITNTDLASDWDNNTGLPNTFIGGLKDITVEVETILSAVNTPTIVLGTWVDSDLQHFDANLSYSLRHLGKDPQNFRVTFDFVMEGFPDDQYTLHLMKDSGGVITTEYNQTRTIDRLAGVRDVTYFNGVFGVAMLQNDFLYWEVENITSGANCTLEADSQWFVEER